MSTTRGASPIPGRPDVFSQSLGDAPWTVGDLRRVLSYLLLALIGIVVAWIGASGTTVWRDQLIWTAIGVGAAVFSAATVANWLLTGLARVRSGKADLKAGFRGPRTLPAVASGPFAQNGSASLVWSPGMSRYHRPDCDLVSGKRTQFLTRTECDRRHLRACGMCQP